MKPALAKAVLSVAALLVSLAALDTYLRLWAPQAIYAIRYCYLGWCHVSAASFVHGAETGEFVTRVRYNSQGLRDHEYPVAKQPGALRVLLFGDSFAEGLEVELDDLHAKRLERQLRAHHPGQSIEVINFGVSAYDTGQEWRYFREEGARYGPNLVILLWNGEAGSPFVRLEGGRPVFQEPRYARQQMWLREARTFLKLHFHVVSFVSNRLGLDRSVRDFQRDLTGRPGPAHDYGIPPDGRPTLPFSQEWETQVAIFEDFARVARAHGATLLVATVTSRDCRWLAESLRLRPIAGLVLVDLQRVGDAEERAYRFPRDSHWNPRGHEKAARILFEAIRRRNLLALDGAPKDVGEPAEVPAC